MANPHVTVSRTGDQFTYRHTAEKEDRTRTLHEVFEGADYMMDQSRRVSCALSFLNRSLLAIAEHGGGLDEYGVRGVADLCDMISDVLVLSTDSCRTEADIIENMAGSEVARG